jgi:hypothetical protein
MRLGAAKGVFGACMGVALINDGPVTLLLEVWGPRGRAAGRSDYFLLRQ